MSSTIHRKEIWYSAEWRSWLTTSYNAEGDTIGESETHFHKADAILYGALSLKKGEWLFIFTATNKFQKKVQKT